MCDSINDWHHRAIPLMKTPGTQHGAPNALVVRSRSGQVVGLLLGRLDSEAEGRQVLAGARRHVVLARTRHRLGVGARSGLAGECDRGACRGQGGVQVL